MQWTRSLDSLVTGQTVGVGQEETLGVGDQEYHEAGGSEKAYEVVT